MLQKSPGFTLIAVAALGLGIGVNTAMFSVADAFLLKPMPLPEIGRLVMLFEQHKGQTSEWNGVDIGNYVAWMLQAKSFEPLAASEWADFNLSGGGDAERVAGAKVTANFFATVRSVPMIGRTFVPEESEKSGHDAVAILSYGLWQRRYGGDRAIAGRTIKVDSKSYTVIGVMPREFNFPMAAELWTPLPMDPTAPMIRGNYSLQVVGRLKNGVSIEQAQAEMQTIAGRLAGDRPDTNRGWGARVVPVRKFISGELTYRYTLLLACAVGFVLLIACANVANLQFARAAGRQKEIAVRTAMGASRWRVVRQLLTESVLAGLGGAVAGLLVGEWALDLIRSNMPAEVAKFIAGWNQIRLDGRAFLFTLGVASLAGIISGLAPALVWSKPDLNEALKESTRGASGAAARTRLRSMLLVAEVSLALVLLVGAGLMTKGVGSLLNVNQQFAPESLLTMRLAPPESKYRGPRQVTVLYEQALIALGRIPGVSAATLATTLPYGHGSNFYGFLIEGHPGPAPGELRQAQIQAISPNYFRTMHIALRAGRMFSDRDGPDSPQVAIIGEKFARRYFAGEDPVGRRIKFDASDPWMTIVGVAEDVRYGWLDRDPAPALYRPYRQSWWPYTYLAARTSGDPMRLAAAVRRQIATVDPDLPVFDIKTLDRVIHESVLGLSYVAVMMSVLGVIALVLACVGVYGVMAYAVTERTREIGIRMALGAERMDVLRMVIAHGMLITCAGLAIGFTASLMLARVLSSLIFGVSATDWQIFGGISLALALAALTASYVPARRATRVDPVVALRYE